MSEKARRIIYDVKTGEIRKEEFDYIPIASLPKRKIINLDKLVDKLIELNIITDKSEIEDEEK